MARILGVEQHQVGCKCGQCQAQKCDPDCDCIKCERRRRQTEQKQKSLAIAGDYDQPDADDKPSVGDDGQPFPVDPEAISNYPGS